MDWRQRIYDTAAEIAASFETDSRVVAIAIGGSIGRRQVWKHSDLELCLIVEEPISELSYFNVSAGLGVEIIQIERRHVKEWVDAFREPDETLLKFPVQIYKCRITHDPSGLLGRFKKLYDKSLFHESIRKLKREAALTQSDAQLAAARTRMAEGAPCTAIAHLRMGLNDLLLAYYWHHGILPRSQNRTIRLLKHNSSLIGHTYLYDAFIAIYGLDEPLSRMKKEYFGAQNDIMTLTNQSWGTDAAEFLRQAVDSKLEWGQTRSMLYVYKLCVHWMYAGQPDASDIYDQPSFREQNGGLYQFLNMDDLTTEKAWKLVSSFQAARERI
ncbi:hypothetical protein [Paenibacillus sp. YIM B09110]|uniref:hypothetical protein n=1 Tax=Paenibacillus sp. YIM B09110 TaxID=3126102 RepID=UPI00301B958C